MICQKSNSRTPNSNVIKEIIAKEKLAGLDTDAWMQDFNSYMIFLLRETQKVISSFPENTVWFGYGAPAKAVTFINEFDLASLKIFGIIDDNLEKQGKFLPLSGISVVSKYNLLQGVSNSPSNSEYACIIFPWNLSDEIIERLPILPGQPFKAVWFLPTFKERRIDT